MDGVEIQQEQGLKVTQFPQDVPHNLSGTVYDVVADGYLSKGGSPLNQPRKRSLCQRKNSFDGRSPELPGTTRNGSP